MITVFYDNKIWETYGFAGPTRLPTPIYAMAYNDESQTWWMWYHSWNNITEDIKTGGRELPPIAQMFLLVAP